MTIAHRLYIFVLSFIVLVVTAALVYYGFSFYNLPIEERPFHAAYSLLRPSGPWGHGFGVVGSLCMIFGMILYMARKRFRWMAHMGLLKHWLEFHIFLCTLGPILVLFHTSLKFGGLVAISFWSMVAVFLSGIIGRFIYIQIPRTIEGRELSLSEVSEMKSNIGTVLSGSYKMDEESLNVIAESTRRRVGIYHKTWLAGYFSKKRENRRAVHRVKEVVSRNGLSRKERREVLKLVKYEIAINRRIDRLLTMQKVFRYWHVAHLPFALVMLIIMVIHVAVTIVFGYHWIF